MTHLLTPKTVRGQQRTRAGYAERAANDTFEMMPEQPGFSTRGGLKDAKHIQNLATASGVPMPVVDVVVENLKEVINRGGGDALDWGSSALLVRERAGLESGTNLLKRGHAPG